MLLQLSSRPKDLPMNKPIRIVKKQTSQPSTKKARTLTTLEISMATSNRIMIQLVWMITTISLQMMILNQQTIPLSLERMSLLKKMIMTEKWKWTKRFRKMILQVISQAMQTETTLLPVTHMQIQGRIATLMVCNKSRAKVRRLQRSEPYIKPKIIKCITSIINRH